jgi:hypothetical protein
MAKAFALTRLGTNGASFELLLEDWRKQCEAFGEDFETYSQIPISIFEGIMAKDKDRTGITP